MKKIIFSLITIFCSFTFISKAQDNLAKLTASNVYDVSNYVSANYKLKDKTLDTLCLYTTVFIKFKVSENGNIDQLELTESTPSIIKKALEKAIKSSNGNWSNALADQAYFSGKLFILPIVLFYGRGCEKGDGELNLNVPVEEYRKIHNTTLSANYAVQDLLKINGKPVNMLECVILSPLSMGISGH